MNDDVVTDNSQQYLIRTPGMADESFNILKQLGRFTNYTGATLDAMMGLASRTAPVIELPDSADYLRMNADGEGNSIMALVKDALADTTALGRYGYLVEPPSAMLDNEGNLLEPSKADQDAGKVQTYIKPYITESIVDHEISVVMGVRQLSLVKLQEEVTTRNPDSFQLETDTVYRFLVLTEDGYEQRIYGDIEGGDLKDGPNPVTGFDGKQLDHIPFFFSGSRNNDASADNPPFYKLADKNIAMYNSDASNRLNLQLYATGTMILTGDAEDLGGKDLSLGGGSGVYLGTTGNASILQLQAGTALPEAIAQDKADMVELGAKLSAPSVQRTLGEAEISATQEMALLTDVTANVEASTLKAINEVIYLQTGVYPSETDATLTLNRKFFIRPMTSQDRAQWVNEIVTGISPKTIYYQRLRDAGEFPQSWTDEMIAEAVDPVEGLIE